jgi:hypothetical protein
VDIRELLVELKKEEIPHDWYHVGHKGVVDCTTCIEVIDGKWAVYFLERGHKENLTFHESVSAACDDLLSRMREQKQYVKIIDNENYND